MASFIASKNIEYFHAIFFLPILILKKVYLAIIFLLNKILYCSISLKLFPVVFQLQPLCSIFFIIGYKNCKYTYMYIHSCLKLIMISLVHFFITKFFFMFILKKNSTEKRNKNYYSILAIFFVIYYNLFEITKIKKLFTSLCLLLI